MIDNKRKKKRIQIVVGGCIIGILICAGIWLKVSSMPIEYQSPPRPAFPKTNAFDLYVKAGNELKCSKQLEEALLSNPPSYMNNLRGVKLPKDMPRPSLPPFAAPGYPGQNVDKTPLPPGVPAAGTLERLYNTAEKQAVINANLDVLIKLRDGMKYDFVQPADAWSKDPMLLTKFRGLARLLVLQSELQYNSGEYARSMSSALDVLKFGNDTAKGGNLIIGLSSVSIQSMARKPAQRNVDFLNIKETQAAISRLNAIIDDIVPYKSIMQEEAWFGLEHAKDAFNAKDWRKRLATPDELTYSDEPATWRDSVRFAWEYTKTFGLSRRGLFYGFHKDHATMLRAIEQPYMSYVKVEIPISNMLSENTMPIYEKSRFRFEYNRCMSEFLLLQLALHAYKLEHGSYPETLDNLSPEYIKVMPQDPFTGFTPYCYKLTLDGYTLYSVGPDTKDDGGKRIVRPKSFPPKGVDPDDIGDIIAGYNI